MIKWSIKMKLGLLCSFLMLTILVVGVVGLVSTKNIIEEVVNLGEVELPAVRNVTLVDMMHDGLRAVVLEALTVTAQDTEKKNSLSEEIKDKCANIREYIQVINKLNTKPDTKKAIQDTLPEVEVYAQISEEIVKLSVAGKKDLANQKMTEFNTAYTNLEQKLETLGELIEKDASTSQESARSIVKKAEQINIVLIILSLVVGVASSLMLTIGLSKTLTSIAGHLSQSASLIISASEQIERTSKELAESRFEQSSSLEKTAESLSEITAMISKAAENGEVTSNSSSNSEQKAEEGRVAANQMMSSIKEISQSNQNIMDQINTGNQQMLEIVKVIQEIGSKTKIINEIVFQTKLLSFNASVEAARAGEHGKGFSVVAEEVGNLAKLSGNAAKEISEMLDHSVSRVDTILSETKTKAESLIAQGKTRVDSGVSVAQKCSDLLNEIVQNVNQVSKLSQEVLITTQEQSKGVSQINTAMEKLDLVTQKSSSISQESSTAANHLSQQADVLKKSVDDLLKIVEG
ncbi:MAG: methyl-accepting chemotaxis protein [Pseudobdellovibrio sp.]